MRELGRNLRKSNRELIPQLGEINTPRRVDTGEQSWLYDGFMVRILAWTNEVSKFVDPDKLFWKRK